MAGRVVGLKQVAAHLGLSPATVSRALNGYPEISAATRARVAAAAAALGYRPNPSARQLATGRASAVGLVFPLHRLYLAEALFFDFIVGVSDVLTRRNYDLVLSPFQDDEGGVFRRLAAARSVDGVILNRPLVCDPRVPLLQALGLPFVLHGRTEADQPYAHVDIDNESVFAQLAGLLLDLGHRRIASLNASSEFTYAAARARSLARTFAARGLAADPALHYETPMNEESGYVLTRGLLDRPDPPTALICGSVFLAQGAYRALRDRGLEPGRDMAVVAHDDLVRDLRAAQFQPALTATQSSVRQAGERSAEVLLDQLAAPGAEPVQEVWPVELVFRASAMPAPA